MKVLVVGGAGYIGSVMCSMLSDSGYEVAVIDDLSNGHRETIRDFESYEVDLRDSRELALAVKRTSPDAAMHFASLILAGESVEKPLDYFRVNVSGALNLANALLDADCGKLIFSSSAAVYGVPEEIPIEEDNPRRPINPYGLSKMIIEDTLSWLERAYGLKHISLRYFNAAGADLEHDLGEDHDPETHLIPRVILVAMGRLDEFGIYGTDYPTNDGTCIRDYIHVVDLCRAHLLALEALESDEPSGTFNLGNGNGFSVKEVVEVVKEVSGVDFPVAIRDRRPGDPPALVASSAKAKRVLGWEPEYPDITEMVKSAWRWHTAHPQGYGD